MKRVMQLFGDKENIRERVRSIIPYADMSLSGSYDDNVLEVEDITDRASEQLFIEFASEYYGNGESNLAGTLINRLQESNMNIATAESCTGGLVASEIVSVPGASEVFYEGLVTYSNEAKMARLGVSVDTLRTFGAVSEETAVEMANGLLEGSADIGVSTTGIAGPGGGTSEKPVGLVYIAVVSEKKTDVYRNVFTGTRNEIRRKACNHALFYALKHIDENY